MGKNKQKNRKPDEQLLGENRLQRKQIRKLEQKIRSLEKELGYSQNKDTSKKYNKKQEVELEPNCIECARGFLREISLVGRTFIVCSVCDYRKKI